MNNEEIQQIAFQIILFSGEARGLISEGFEQMRSGLYDDANLSFDQANDKIIEAHRSQTSLLTENASGKDINISVILVHAQDHLMTTMTLLDVAKEMMFLYKKIDGIDDSNE